MLASVQLHVKQEVAATFPARPDRVRECMQQAERAMRDLASDRRRHLTEPPRLIDMRDTGLGLVELTFHADTASD